MTAGKHKAQHCPSQKVEEVAAGEQSFQERVRPWMLECFGAEIAADKEERNHRFLEEALELVQSCGATRSEAHQLVDYTFDRPIDPPQREVGGVMVTLAALCLAQGFDMHECAEAELARVWTKIETIRAKQAAKPKHSPLPEHHAATTPVISDAARKAAEEIANTITQTQLDWAWLSLNRGDERASEVSKRVAPDLGGKVLDQMTAIISRHLPVPVEDEIVYVYEAFDNTMQCRRCKEVFKPDMNNRFSVIHSCKSSASAVLKRETPRYED